MPKNTNVKVKLRDCCSRFKNTIFSQQGKFIAMFFLTGSYCFAELIVGYKTNSMALVADSFHMCSDLLSLAIGFLSMIMTNKSFQSDLYTYGYGRSEFFGAFVNSVFLLTLCLTILNEAIQRIINREYISDPKLILFVATAGFFINLLGIVVFEIEEIISKLKNLKKLSCINCCHNSKASVYKGLRRLNCCNRYSSRSSTNSYRLLLTEEKMDDDNISVEMKNIQAKQHTVETNLNSKLEDGPLDDVFSGCRNKNTQDSYLIHSINRNEYLIECQVNNLDWENSSVGTSKPEGSLEHNHENKNNNLMPITELNSNNIKYNDFLITEQQKNSTDKKYSTSYEPDDDDDDNTNENSCLIHNPDGNKDNSPSKRQKKFNSSKDTEIIHSSSCKIDSPGSKSNSSVKETKCVRHTCHGHSHSHSGQLNIRGVILHIIGDLLGSIVVIISTTIFIFFKNYKWALFIDPIMSILLVIILFRTTIPLLIESVKILLLQTPKTYDKMTILNSLKLKFPEIVNVAAFHIWQASSLQIIASIRIVVQECDFQEMSKKLSQHFHNFNLHNVTVMFEREGLPAMLPHQYNRIVDLIKSR